VFWANEEALKLWRGLVFEARMLQMTVAADRLG
jgi:hypothetical protein